MARKTKAFTSITLMFILTLVLGCSLVPKGIQRIFVTETPTSTATPTATATATATPKPPVSFTLCAKQEDCPKATSFYSILGESLDYDAVNELKIPYNTSLLINQQWQSLDDDLLADNKDHIHWFFKIDGQEYFQQGWVEPGTFENVVDPTINYPGIQWGVVLENWKLGESHLVEVGYSLDEAINDGWMQHEAGYEYHISLHVVPSELPTATPTSTQTPTATKTNTPRPTAIPYTSTPKPTPLPACEINSTIEIDNTTGGWLTLKLKGPGSFNFNLSTGVTVLDVCSGSYSYEAWGCGGAYDSGTLGSNEAHEFYCN